MLKFIRRQLCFWIAILFISVFIFPTVFLYGISLLVEYVVGKETAARIEAFWDAIGRPYNWLLEQSEPEADVAAPAGREKAVPTPRAAASASPPGR